MNDGQTMRFEFTYSSGDSLMHHAFEVADDEQWSEVSRRFRDFLSAVYGYEIPANG
jgi:hypothetical protein